MAMGLWLGPLGCIAWCCLGIPGWPTGGMALGRWPGPRADGARPGEASEESVEDTPEMFFQSIVISSVKLKMDYHPKRVDLNGLREGNYVELLNVLPMEGLCLLLPKVELYSLNGFGELGEYLITKGADNRIVNAAGKTCYEGLG